MSRRPVTPFAVLSALAWLAAGCAQQSQPASFYMLSYEDGAGQPAPATTTREGIALGVGPVELPDYLDRPQLVRRASSNRLEIEEFDRWAGPLQENVTAVLVEVLSAELQTDRITAHPWRAPLQVEYQAVVDVMRFDTDAAGRSVLEARWSIVDAPRQRVVATARSTFRQDIAAASDAAASDAAAPAVDYDAIAAAMSRNVVALGRAIAERIRSLPTR